MTEACYYISTYVHIRNNEFKIDGKARFENKDVDFSTFIKAAYKHLNADYSKFFKMDNLSKLAFLGADALLEKAGVLPENEENIAIVLSNRASSLETDRKHQESIANPLNYFPSPAVFVYTLPNICIGEISIKYRLYSENSFFIFDRFNPSYLKEYCASLLDDGKADKVLCGWVDFDSDNYEAFLYLVGNQGDILHNTEAIKSIY